jgi:hypothetical protein
METVITAYGYVSQGSGRTQTSEFIARAGAIFIWSSPKKESAWVLKSQE